MSDPDDDVEPDCSLPAEGPGSLAGLGARALARVSDAVVQILIPQSVLFALFVVTSREADDTLVVEYYPLWLVPLQIAILAAWEIGMVAWRSQTLGMLLGGLRIVDATTSKPVGMATALRRAILPVLVYALSARFLLAGMVYLVIYLSPLLDTEGRQGWHDRIARTRVVRAR